MAIAKKSFVNMDDVDEKQLKTVMKGAALTEKKKNTAGRKPKLQEDKATEPLVAYVTPENKESVQAYCDKMGVSISSLFRQFLVEKGIL